MAAVSVFPSPAYSWPVSERISRTPGGRGRAVKFPAGVGDDDDAGRFEDLYSRHHLAAYRLALLLCAGEEALAEDSMSEALARVYPKWLDGGVEDFGAYLRRAVANQVKAAFRHRGVERRQDASLLADARETLPFDEHVGQRDQMWRALAELPLKQRTVIVLYYYEQRPIEEIARITKTGTGTVKAHLSRGRDRLRQLLEQEGVR
jgi:RNA polymerase sigma factor (sigma-70 family)